MTKHYFAVLVEIEADDARTARETAHRYNQALQVILGDRCDLVTIGADALDVVDELREVARAAYPAVEPVPEPLPEGWEARMVHGDCAACYDLAHQAIGMARASGSVGSTFGKGTHGAAVSRKA